MNERNFLDVFREIPRSLVNTLSCGARSCGRVSKMVWWKHLARTHAFVTLLCCVLATRPHRHLYLKQPNSGNFEAVAGVVGVAAG